MNYIHKLKAENEELKQQLARAKECANELRIYLASEKFHGITNDYVHVSTDMIIRVNEIYNLLSYE